MISRGKELSEALNQILRLQLWSALTFLLLACSHANAQTTTSGTSTNRVIAVNGPMPPPPPPLVLTNPPPSPVPQFPVFSTLPTPGEIEKARIFDEPLIQVGGIASQAENTALAQALVAFASRTTTDDFSALENYLDSWPNGCWYASVLFNLGWEHYNTGYYSEALDDWEEDWYLLEDEDAGAPKQLADRCLGELAKMHARIGDYQRLEELFGQIGDRTVTGSASELVAGAKQAFWLMKNRPGISFRCGPLALRNICKLLQPQVDVDEIIEDSASTTNGFSLVQLQQLSDQLQLNFQIAKRQSGTPLLLPCVVHWNVGHYAAVLAQQGGLYFVVDPTFGTSRWMSQAAIDAEASGYFLVPPGSLTNGWQAVASTEAATVWGKGVTGGSDPNNTTPYDEMADPTCGSSGMATYNLQLMLVSLHIEDTPISFVPPRGPPINFTVSYNQREANQPTRFNYSNFGEKWTCNWISYLTDNSTNTAADVQYYVPGGGTEVFTYNTTNSSFDVNWRNQGILTRLNSTNYQIAFPDGSTRIFGQPNGAVGSTRKIFLTQIIDPTGYTNLLNYDSNLRLVSVTDPQASATNLTFYYAVSGMVPVDIYKIQSVTDRYGRSATMNYSNTVELQSITDVLGITSQFQYLPNSDFIEALQTPYGTTTFSFGDDGNMRWLEATDPQGGTSRAEFNQSADTGVPDSDPGTIVPRTTIGPIYTRNYVLYGRNTFYWDKNAMENAPGDYSKARIYHWLHNANLASAEGCLESIKEPLENRVWFNYPGQSPFSSGATIYGTQNLPCTVGRVLDGGFTQLYQYFRNSLGYITNSIDPIGFSFNYDYATNQIDLLKVRQTSGGSNELVASYTYNSQHLPLTAVDASGQTNRFVYNSYGQITAFTNALLQATTFNYDSAGRLLSIVGPTNIAVTSFGYDAFDRVSAVTNSDGYYVHISYDAFDRPTNNTYPDGSTETFTYKYLDPQTYVDRAGKVTQFTYDSLRHLTQITEATNWNTYLDWCTCGNLQSLTDPLGRTTQWFYDIQGRLITKQYADGSSVKYGYENTTSRLKTFTNERNQTRTFQYYTNNLFKEVDYSNPTNTPTLAFSYDDYGRPIAMFDGYSALFHTNYTFSYYPVTSPPSLGAGRLKAIVDPNGQDVVSYSYDALGRVQSAYLNNSAFTGTYGWGHTAYTYDVLGRVTQDITKDVGTYNFTYAGASSRLLSISYPASLTTTFGYYGINGDFRLLGLTNYNNYGNALLSKFNYAYDKEGLITNMVRQLGTGPLITNVCTYDAIGELLNVTSNNNATAYSYSYDLAGNRTLEKNGTNSWRAWFNPLNEIQGKDQGLSSTNRTYQFDEENRVINVTEGGASVQMVYNGFGHLAYLTELNYGLATMIHWFVWSGNKIAEESFQSPSSGTYYQWYYDYGNYDTGGPTYVWTTRDGLGSPREIYGGQFNLLGTQYDYDPFGRQSTLVSVYARPPSFGFTGMLGMPGHNLDFAEHRTYDPDLGRWLSRDPIGEAGGLNLYGYAGNNPVNYIDPSGLCPVTGSSSGGNRPPRTPIVASATGGDDEDENSFPDNAAGLTTPVGELRAAGLRDAHHIVQDAAVRDLAGYDTQRAPGVQLPGPSTAVGTPHYIATQVQRQAGGGTLGAELRIGYKSLRQAGYSEAQARQAIAEAEAYFNSIGATRSTPTRIPGNR